MARHVLPALLLLAVGAAGCGGHTAKYRFDDAALASLSWDDKQPILAAQQELTLSRAKEQQAIADADAAGRDVETARLDYDRARLAVDQAKIDQDVAAQSKDQNQIARAVAKRRVADLGKRAADAKVDTLEAKKKWAKAQREVAGRDVDAALAKVEMEKARLAVAKNIRPKDFNPDQFMTEYAERQLRLDEARRDADEKRIKYDEKVSRQREADGAWQDAVRASQPPPGYGTPPSPPVYGQPPVAPPPAYPANGSPSGAPTGNAPPGSP